MNSNIKKDIFIGIAGNIGVGKTTFTQVISKKFMLKGYYESVIDNPYLEDFYANMSRWSFNLQIYFLHHRFKDHMEMAKSKTGVIQDRTIYEDVEIFARNLHEMKLMTDRDWDTYRNLFSNITYFLKKPDLIIYLKADTDVLISRIENRNRDFEKKIDSEYLHRLNLSYERWIERIEGIPVIIIDTNEFNIFLDTEKLDEIYTKIEKKMIDSDEY